MNLPQKKILALCQTAAKNFPGTLPKMPFKTISALCQNGLQRLW
jgi:hypothetical protein